MKIVLVNGGFDPIHSGHISYFKAAKALGDMLIVGLNSDEWLERKKGRAFMPWNERLCVINNLSMVDEVYTFDDQDGSAKHFIQQVRAHYPDCKIIFSEQKLSAQDLNAMYNVADVVVNIGSNEGWGLSSTEAILSGTPIVNNVTGGLQDQCGFEDENGEWLRFDGEFATNHTGKYKKHGIWAKPVFPSNRSLQGSTATPYIFDDRVMYEEVADAIQYWYEMTEENRAACGFEGRTWAMANGLTAEQMGNKMISMFRDLFAINREMRPLFTVTKVEAPKYERTGIVA